MDISKETRLKRVSKSNNEKGATFEIEVSQENFDFMESWFEKPTEKEITNGIITPSKYTSQSRVHQITEFYLNPKAAYRLLSR